MIKPLTLQIPSASASNFEMGGPRPPFGASQGMLQHYVGTTVDGSEITKQPLGMLKKLCEEWDKLPTSTGDRRNSEPSNCNDTVYICS